MEPLIGIDDALTHVRQALIDEGYRVVSIAEADGADALVLSGMDTDVAGDHSIARGVPIISAQGRSAADVVGEVRERLHRRQ